MDDVEDRCGPTSAAFCCFLARVTCSSSINDPSNAITEASRQEELYPRNTTMISDNVEHVSVL